VRTSAWWTRRSIIAAAMTSSEMVSPHRPNPGNPVDDLAYMARTWCIQSSGNAPVTDQAAHVRELTVALPRRTPTPQAWWHAAEGSHQTEDPSYRTVTVQQGNAVGLPFDEAARPPAR